MDSRKQKLHLVRPGSDLGREEKLEISRLSRSTKDTRLEKEDRRVKLQRLINKLNYINFQDRTILVTFKHFRYDHTLRIEAKPNPCNGEHLECRWDNTEDLSMLTNHYRFDSLLVPDGRQLLKVHADIHQLDGEGIRVKLPEVCYEICSRKVTRHRCRDIQAQIIQNSTIFKGELIDFNAVSFRVQVTSKPPQTFQWLNTESPVTVLFSNQNDTCFTGECRILHQTRWQRTREYVLEPIRKEIQRFKHKEFRSARHTISPSPDIVFRHPFTAKVVTLKAIDLSGAGFSVEEDPHNAVLLPGLMIPELELCFAGSMRFKCKAQVVYRHAQKDNRGEFHIRCGLALLDMDIEKHVQLVALLQQAANEHSYVCNKVDLDDLWDFFFETGFIYPNKYEFIQKNKERIKETYEKLYARNPSIARHFIYQDRGKILGHMAMVRFYENTWLIHHHASRNSDYNRAGLAVLNQIGSFGNDSHRLYSTHMDFLMCYYRPDNKFPRRVFGGAVTNIKNPKGCSTDLFAYFHYFNEQQPVRLPSDQWSLTSTVDSDFQELSNCYEHLSGGLMIDALSLNGKNENIGDFQREYEKLGFKRDRGIRSLKKNGLLKAIIMADLSDIGLNLSDLTNNIKIFVVDEEGLNKEVLFHALSNFMTEFDQDVLPVLIYPSSFADAQQIPIEKHYHLWAINMQNTDDYFRYLNRLLRFVKK